MTFGELLFDIFGQFAELVAFAGMLFVLWIALIWLFIDPIEDKPIVPVSTFSYAATIVVEEVGE